jgi:hypothetical protein
MLYWAMKIQDIKGMDAVSILKKHQPKANAEITEEDKGGWLSGGKRKAILCGQIQN